MTTQILPIFEDSTSPLYHSNDGRLKVGKFVATSKWAVHDTENGEYLIATADRVLVDAYIAGYDYARDATKSSDVPPGADSGEAA